MHLWRRTELPRTLFEQRRAPASVLLSGSSTQNPSPLRPRRPCATRPSKHKQMRLRSLQGTPFVSASRGRRPALPLLSCGCLGRFPLSTDDNFPPESEDPRDNPLSFSLIPPKPF